MKKLIVGKRYWLNYEKSASGLYNGPNDYADLTFIDVDGKHNYDFEPDGKTICFGIVHKVFKQVSK